MELEITQSQAHLGDSAGSVLDDHNKGNSSIKRSHKFVGFSV